jgi:glycolate oxidase subunit GlcD
MGPRVSTLPAALERDLRASLGDDALITDPDALLVYETDALPAHRARPRAVLLPRTHDDVVASVRMLARAGIPFAARGAGTGLSGGAIATGDGVVISLARMNRILALDPANRFARVEAGVVNARLNAAARPHGLRYAPDPSSEPVCTIGGNIAENSGGPHCLKYGVTMNHVLGLDVVLTDGSTVRLGGAGRETAGLDLLGVFIGSEGTFGIATVAEVRLTPLPDAVETLLALFDDVDDASRSVSAIIAAGLLPAALEMVDRQGIIAVEGSPYGAGMPTDIEGALVIEFDGPAAGPAADAERAREICVANHAREVRRAESEEERNRLWHARKKAYGAMGRLAPDLLVQDATVPRSRLPLTMSRVYEVAHRYGLRVSNTFHAGDGNLHPKILFDRREPDIVERVARASREIMLACVEAGGTITGEHGVGLDKRDYMSLIYGPAELEAMRAVRRAFDPLGLANPGKVIPPADDDAPKVADGGGGA